MTIGPDTYMHDVIAVCGGRNVFEGRQERYPGWNWKRWRRWTRR